MSCLGLLLKHAWSVFLCSSRTQWQGNLAVLLAPEHKKKTAVVNIGEFPTKVEKKLDFEKLTNVMRDLALEAGDKIMEIYGKDDFGVRSKSDQSPVTEADEAADALISAGLRSAFPDVALVTEEQSETHSESASRFLIVDPLDGTKEFIKRRGDFTVNIAYVVDGSPVRGVVYAPAKGRLFYTGADGASVEESGPFKPGSPGSVSNMRVTKPDNTALIVVASKSHRDQATDDYISKYAVADMTGAGSSLKFCLVASGEADFYPRLGRTMEWDTAAGHAVLAGAGGQVVRFDNHEDLSYGKPEFENPFFIAMAPGVDLKSSK